MSKDTGYPIFSVDYRLAPEFTHPVPLSDCWMVYLWLWYYAEEYLQLTFDKIILVGDSAGGNLWWGVANLAILKNWRVPDGLELIYPGLIVSRTLYFPSLLCSLDDPILNTVFLDYCLKAYDPEGKGDEDFLLSPIVAPDSQFVRDGKVVFPPTRIIASGNDPLRDLSILYTVRLAKLGVDIQWVDYRYQMHGFIMFSKGPISFTESKEAIDRVIQQVAELGSLGDQK